MPDKVIASLRADIARKMLKQGDIAKQAGVSEKYLSGILREKVEASPNVLADIIVAIRDLSNEES